MKKAVLILFLILMITASLSGDNITFNNSRLVISVPSSKIEYNPLFSYSSTEAQLFTALYEGLVSYDPLTLHPLPAAAESWTVSADKKEYTFNLRTNLYYWDGVKVTAEDFRNSWLKMITADEDIPYAFLLDIVKGVKDFRAGLNKDPVSVGIEVIDKYILKVILDTPAEHFLKILCHHSFSPVHPGFINKKDWSDLPSAPGNGPYYVYKKSDDSILLKKNLLYWDAGKVLIPEIMVMFVDDPDTNTSGFNSGSIHWAAGNFYSDLVENKKHIVFNHTFATTYFFFNSRTEPWDNMDARKAFLLSAPFEEIRDREYVFFPASTLVPLIPDYPKISGQDKQDMEKAFQYLETADISDIPEIIIKIPESTEIMRSANLIKEAWEQFSGKNVIIKIFNFNDYYSELKINDYTLGVVSWIGDFPDPLSFLQMWTTGSSLNDSGFSSSDFDRAIDDSMLLSGSKRYASLSEAEQILLDSAVVIPLSNTPSINLIDTDRIEGWYPNPLDIHPVKYLRFKKARLHPGLAVITE